MRKVNVIFVLEGKADQPQEALLLTGDKVLVSDDEGIGVYRITTETTEPNTYIVNLDENNTDIIAKSPKSLYDLILKGANSTFRWISA
ncbi:hypothetical protein [Heyndrickxia acidicola]|uniref:Uncharacterized protein n=1 Tax=Heyndrickxia acidicola TaxID=209389 RepID=A0ABU6MD25_9BACI|nr:hypothetical protein [Heyndrickxia acidicola]MED1202561.1 hypothetical protein [Heyndrickxia acidicola]